MLLEELPLRDSPNPVLILPIAPSGSGKTTLREHLVASNPDLCVISPDDIRFDILRSAETGIHYDLAIEAEVWEKTYAQLRECVGENRSIFVDATNVSAKARAEVLAQVPDNYFVVFDVLNVPEGVAQERNRSRKRIVPPEVVHRQYETFASNPIMPGEADLVIWE